MINYKHIEINCQTKVGDHPLSAGITTPLYKAFFIKKMANSAISSTEISFSSGFFPARTFFMPDPRYSVSTKPGQITLQATPCDAYPSATDLARDARAVFAAAYAAFVLKPRTESVRVPPKSRIRPHPVSHICGREAETREPGKARFEATTSAHSSGVVSCRGFCKKGPRTTHRISA